MATHQIDLFKSPEKPRRVLTAMEKLRAERAAYQRTAKWKKLRKAKIEQTGGQCERCGSWPGRKDVHHKDTAYQRLGSERLEDLMVLCTHCHEIEDERRAVEAKRRAARAWDNARFESELNNARFERGLNTFGTNKYGEGWQEYHDDIAQEFAEWLEGR